MAERTIYSDKHPGDAGNYRWLVRFDRTSGYLGITQWRDDIWTERVLLSPSQVRALLAFVRPRARRKASRG